VLDEQTGAPAVVALGGGALLDRLVRLEALERAVVVTLQAEPGEIHRRAERAPGSRPLLAASEGERLLELLEARRPGYAECHARVATDARSPDEIAQEVLTIWQRVSVVVAAGERSYTVDVGSRIVTDGIARTLDGASLGLLVTDRNVAAHHADPVQRAIAEIGVRSATVVLEPGEEHKNVKSLERIWLAALAAGADRKSRLVALGGGVVTDVGGFAAATWMRGIDWVAVPTTLLAMVDASVGGKTAIDLPDAKNAVGAFWQPSSVLCDVELLSTEPARGYTSALAEVVKTALIGDAELFALLEKEVAAIRRRDPGIISEMVLRSIRVKARVVSLDERESGLRACLNLGHTVGHALEAFGGYGQLRHGEAVSLGLVAALRIGERLGLTPRTLVARAARLLAALGLPVDLSAQPLSEAAELIGHDKKRAGTRLRFVAARDVAQVELVDLATDGLRAYIVSLHA
jgi:shikimate kinase/3-dehydroquinate synthase